MLILNVYFREDIRIESRVSAETTIICDACGRQEALIFQYEGNFCLNCWQTKTEPDVNSAR